MIRWDRGQLAEVPQLEFLDVGMEVALAHGQQPLRGEAHLDGFDELFCDAPWRAGSRMRWKLFWARGRLDLVLLLAGHLLVRKDGWQFATTMWRIPCASQHGSYPPCRIELL